MTEQTKERIALLDVVRGLAVLGILLMNIRLFSEPSAAYFNPLAWGDHAGLNKLWFWFQALFADQKFMAIFSMLFGASTAIICDGLARRGEAVARTYAKRIFGLLLIGLFHAYLLWPGDILVPYAIGSIIPFIAKNWRWQISMALGISLLVLGTIWYALAYYGISMAPPDAQAVMRDGFWLPSRDVMAAEVAAHQGSYSEHFAYRVEDAFAMQTSIFLNWGVWRIGGMMLIGLALYRQGFLRGKLSARSYGTIALIALPVGFALAAQGLAAYEAAGWAFPYSFFLASAWNYWGSALMAVGYMALVGWLLTSTSFRAGFNALSNVGRAALSNYLFQTVACISIFYGFGLGLYGELERWQTAFIVLGVWAVQIALSAWWFRSHDKGPVEAIWHRFTYTPWFGRKEQAA